MIFPKAISARSKLFTNWSNLPLTLIKYRILPRVPINVRKKLIFSGLSVYWFYRMPMIEENMKLINPDLNSSQIGLRIERLKKVTMQNFAAAIDIKPIDLERGIEELIEVTGDLDRVLDLYLKGEKLVITSCHTGPYDKILPLFVAVINSKLKPRKIGAYVPAENIPWAANIMADLRKKSVDNIDFDPIKKGETIPKSEKRLDDGDIVLLTSDMIRSDNRGVLCHIGAAEARFPVGWAVLAHKKNATVIHLFPSGGQRGRVLVEVAPPFSLKKTGDIWRDTEYNVRRFIEEDCGPFLQKHSDEWLQIPRIHLRPIRKNQ